MAYECGSSGAAGYEQLSLFRSHNSCRAKLNVNRKYVFFRRYTQQKVELFGRCIDCPNPVERLGQGSNHQSVRPKKPQNRPAATLVPWLMVSKASRDNHSLTCTPS